MAKQYRRPILTFYLEQIPRPSDIGEDFRTLPEQGDPTNALLRALLRDIKARQTLIREIVEEDEDVEFVRFVASQRQASGVNAVASVIRRDIEFDREVFRSSASVDEAFSYVRTCAETSGIFVILAGDLGSWQTAIDVRVFRGFAISDRLAPVIVINDQDAKAAWSFTLLHELAHLWLGVSGISGGIPTPGLERFCNDVAAAILVDPEEIASLPIGIVTSDADAARLVTEFAANRKLSRSMVAYQLYRQNKLSQQSWRALSEQFHAQWLATKAQQRQAAREREGGVSYYVVRRHRLGTALLELVRRGLSEGNLTPIRAGKILGVKPMAVYPIVANPDRGGRAA
jgi:Zn-dependent peptidase ImmA (M78 family)